MSHVCEHFETSYIPTLFKMVYDFLEPNGQFICHVPNFKWHAALILEDKDEEAVHYAFGGQLDKYDFHKTAFTPVLLFKRLGEAGFRVEKIQVEHSIHCIAVKIDNVEHKEVK
jgi:predicted SAM-dependent methyltransferase